MDITWGSGEPPQYPPLPPRPPILEAAAQCNTEMVMRLLDENPALINFRLPEYEQQPLHEAAHWGCNKVVEFLLDRGAEINALDHRRMTPLHHAAETAETKVVKILLKRGANPSLLDVFGFTPLVTAARRLENRGYRTARAMIQEGVKYDLHAAICLGDVATVRSLLDAEPDLPLRYAVPGDLLFDAMLMVQTRTEDYEVSPNMLDESIRDFGPICKLLVSHGVSPNASSRWSGPLLHNGIDIVGDDSYVRFLIELGADVNLAGPSGERPLQIAERDQRTTIQEILKEHGAY